MSSTIKDGHTIVSDPHLQMFLAIEPPLTPPEPIHGRVGQLHFQISEIELSYTVL